MTDFGLVETTSIVWMVIGLFIFIVGPVVLSIFWIVKKKESVKSVLIGAAVFILFAMILEKTIQALLLQPTALGLSDHAISSFFNLHPVLLAFMAGLFPGVFEETGRFVAYKTALKKNANRETAISYGIGHGGIEVIAILGLTYINNIVYSVMINTGAFQSVIDQVMAQAPDQVGQLEQIVSQLTSMPGTTWMLAVMTAVLERIFAVMFHIGASILVFYACRDKGKFWLYPLAVAIHAAMDFVAGLVIFNVISLPTWGIELIFVIFGAATFLGAYLLLYKKDNKTVV